MKVGMAETLAISVVLLMLGRWIKSKSPVLQKFFIPAPVVSGLIFSIFILIGRQTGAFSIAFDLTLQNFLMIELLDLWQVLNFLLKGELELLYS